MSPAQDRRSITTLLQLCKSEKHIFKIHIFKIIVYFFNKSKYAVNYILLFEIYDGVIGQMILKL